MEIQKQKEIFTIGHSNHTLEKFLYLLKTHDIKMLADVRSAPYSRFRPHFNKKSFAQSLTTENIDYIFMGDKLGGRPKDTSCYTDGKVDYKKLASLSSFKHGITELLKSASYKKLAIMCAEKEPLNCHRTVLICKALKAYPIDVKHILADGSLENHEYTEQRMLKVHKLGISLYGTDSRQDLINQAYILQGKRIFKFAILNL